MHELRKGFGAAACIVGLCLFAAPLGAQSECSAELDAQLIHEEKGMETTHLQFEVEVFYDEGDCVTVHYDLILELLLPDGQVKRVRKPRQVKINDQQSESELIEHRMSSSLSLRSFEAKVVSCDPCDMFP